MSIRIAYQGFPGSYSEAAIGRLKEVGLIPSVQDIQPVPCESFEDAFVAVTRHEADRALLPIQNSLGGSIHANYDLLIRFDLKIVGEVHFRVHHALMALPGTRKKDIRVVMSHPQALAQCDEYIRGKLHSLRIFIPRKFRD